MTTKVPGKTMSEFLPGRFFWHLKKRPSVPGIIFILFPEACSA
ncbi:hypothetical protein MmTuc01_2822 [Methanosarcina mazei Tuc01]|uniref:Uncharacterized protein n=1 Tax=Methanosarcina mazei Tuc01 TaxID=1236903 RepID=M1PC48_METMZ|nr:hypothetical protein MmTuc01_2822 [Methanosarcina mazei Tuc01]